MKKLLTIIAAFVITASATVFANNETSAPTIVKSSFETKFGKAINVKWEKIRDVYQLQSRPGAACNYLW